MTATELLNKVKTGLGISGDFHDDILQIYIDTAKQFMISAGVADGIADSEVAVGCILLGVNDLWNYSSGKAEFSEFFKQRVAQLAMTDAADYTPIMVYATIIPDAETAAMFGWTQGFIGMTQNLQANTFTATDEQRITCTVVKPDGTTITAENTGTGNRRTLRIENGTAYIMPDTLYNPQSGRYDAGEGTTIVFPAALIGSEITLETFLKTE